MRSYKTLSKITLGASFQSSVDAGGGRMGITLQRYMNLNRIILLFENPFLSIRELDTAQVKSEKSTSVFQ